jgi:hypothetical protein
LCSWPDSTTSALRSESACQIGCAALKLPWAVPELKRGWCQYASVQRFVLAARSARSHCSWAEPALMLTLLLSETMRQSPRS